VQSTPVVHWDNTLYVYASMHTNSVSKQHPWNYFTQLHGVWTQIYGNMQCIWRPLQANIRIYRIFLETTS